MQEMETFARKIEHARERVLELFHKMGTFALGKRDGMLHK